VVAGWTSPTERNEPLAVAAEVIGEDRRGVRGLVMSSRMKPENRDRILRSRFLSYIVFPHRLGIASRHAAQQVALSVRWLFGSREFANFTYDLTDQNKDQLAWFVSSISGTPVEEIRSYFGELENNTELQTYLRARLRETRRHREFDDTPFYGRRIGWYALVRATQPLVVVETGTEKGLGSLVIAEALKANGRGHLHTIDIEESSGLLIGPEYQSFVTRVHSDSVLALPDIENVDVFLHDSDHSAEHERNEYIAVAANLTESAIVLSDNSHATSELSEWSSDQGRRFYYFAEKPKNHWYPGAGIGVSVRVS
jgi:hypothetical protein